MIVNGWWQTDQARSLSCSYEAVGVGQPDPDSTRSNEPAIAPAYAQIAKSEAYRKNTKQVPAMSARKQGARPGCFGGRRNCNTTIQHTAVRYRFTRGRAKQARSACCAGGREKAVPPVFPGFLASIAGYGVRYDW